MKLLKTLGSIAFAAMLVFGVVAITGCDDILKPTTYTVTFMDGDTKVTTKTVKEGEKITEPNHTKSGHTLDGWYKESTFATKWNFANDTVTENITLYAKWTAGTYHTVTFDPNGGNWDGDEDPIGVPVADGEAIAANEIPDDPEHATAGFGGWYTTRLDDDASTASAQEWDHESPITEDTTVYAYWSTDFSTVTFDANGGKFHHEEGADTDTIERRIANNTLLDQPHNLSNGAYSVVGWYTQVYAIGDTPDESKEWEFSNAYITDDVTLYAYWAFTGTELTLSVWDDGHIAAGGEEWFVFTAQAASHYIHFSAGTLNSVSVQRYTDLNGATAGNSFTLSGSGTTSSRNNPTGLTIGTKYYLKVTPSAAGASGTYRIAFNTGTTAPTTVTLPTTGITDLTLNTWTNGDIPTAGGEQWFKFTATANTNYIHFDSAGTLKDINVNVYDSDGAIVGSQAHVYFSSTAANHYTSRSVTNGQDYFVKITPYTTGTSGTYMIGFTGGTTIPAIIPLPPTVDVPELTANVWKDGEITGAGDQWFKITATAATHYIHFEPGTVPTVYAQLFNADTNTATATRTELSNTTRNASRGSLTNGTVYYLRVKASTYGSLSGTYKIGFNTTTAGPNAAPPSTGITQIIDDTWYDGDIPTAGGEEWFKFTATAASHYIHFDPGTLNDVYVQVYNATTNESVNGLANLFSSPRTVSRTGLTAASEYYIRVTPYSRTASGAYRIGFNTSPASPVAARDVPTSTTALTAAGTWGNGDIPAAGGDQWFGFIATSASHYIHFDTGSLPSVIVELYDDSGRLYNQSGLNITSQNTLTISTRTANRSGLTNGSQYYIRVRPYSSTGISSSGTFKIAFSATAAALNVVLPTAGDVTALAPADRWVFGGITADSGQEWFKFTATDATHYVHFSGGSSVASGTLTDVYVCMYDSAGTLVSVRRQNGSNTSVASSDPQRLYLSSYLYIMSDSLTVGSDYYVRVWGGSTTGTGTYGFALSTTSTVPTSVTLPTTDIINMPTANTWVSGNIPSSDGEQWLSFTATAETQYIHFSANDTAIRGTLIDVYVTVYDSTGALVGATSNNLYGTGESRYTSRTLTIGTVYYIKVWPWSTGSGTYKMAFNTAETRPPNP